MTSFLPHLASSVTLYFDLPAAEQKVQISAVRIKRELELRLENVADPGSKIKQSGAGSSAGSSDAALRLFLADKW